MAAILSPRRSELVCLLGNVKRSMDKQAVLFKHLNKAKWPIMAIFKSNKQTQKCYVTGGVKRNAVIKEGALPLFRKPVAKQRDYLTWPFSFLLVQKFH